MSSETMKQCSHDVIDLLPCKENNEFVTAKNHEKKSFKYTSIYTFDSVPTNLFGPLTMLVLDIDETLVIYESIERKWWDKAISEMKSNILNNIKCEKFIEYVNNVHPSLAQYHHLFEDLNKELMCCNDMKKLLIEFNTVVLLYANELAHDKWLDHVTNALPNHTDHQGFANMIDYAKKTNTKICCVTARLESTRDITEKHLKHIGCDVPNVYFCNKMLKGPIIRKLLGNDINTLVVIDDSSRQLCSIDQEFSEDINISLHLFRFKIQ